MSSNPTPTTGVTGNTNIPQQQHAAAGSSATTNRIRSFAKNNKPLIGILALVATYSIFVTFKSYGMGLGGLLVTLFLLRYAHKLYEKNSKPTVISLIGHLIAAIIALVIINSPYVQKPLEVVNVGSEILGEVDVRSAMAGCIDRELVAVDGYFTLRKTCENQSIETPTGLDPRFYIEDSSFKGGFGEWVASEWDKNRGNTVNFKPLKWPEGKTEVTVRLVTVEKAAEIDRVANSTNFQLSDEAQSAFKKAAQ